MKLFNPEKRLTFPADPPGLVAALHNESRALLSKQGDHRYADGGMLAKAVFLAGACLACYAVALRQEEGLLFFTWYFAATVFAMLLTINVVHDASHDAFLRGKRANVWLNRIAAIPLGLDPDCWRVRHVRYHHGFTNVEGYDPDTAENGLLRQTPWQRWRPFMRAQCYYWPVVAALTFPWYIWIVDWLDRAGLTPVTPQLRRHGVTGWTVFLAGKTAHAAFSLALPVGLLADRFSVGMILLTYMLCQMIVSLVFVMLIIGTHWAKGSVQLPPQEGKMAQGRLLHAFATTFDWSTRPACMGYWLGGVNLHLTHHVFPHWSHRHYPQLSRLIEEIAAREGLDFRLLSLTDLLSFQQRFLRRMGERPVNSGESR
ncbi:fatty acid desaturase family protein [Atlantibacter hermannii]|uniref:fatty acid desaturase family protein n=1 Tax=Atlantibacter hermannii TaxID=565 RepID=UPI003318C5F7